MKNNIEMNPSSFTEDQITQLAINGVINKDEARELLGLNKDKVTLPFHSVMRLLNVGIIEPTEARPLLGFDKT